MKVLISSLGTRGDVQPVLALALELKSRGHEAQLCVAPDFKEWVESYGLTCLPIGPNLRQLTGGTAPKNPSKPSPEQMRQLAAYTVRSQFPALTEAARGCDLIVAGGTLQLATRSVAESLRVPYVFAAYCPAVLPSPDHPPPKIGTYYSQSLPPESNLALWAEEEQSWNGFFRETLNDERGKLGLEAVESVLRHIITDRPWLAADPALAPAGTTSDMQIAQPGAWLLRDRHPLPDRVEEFLSGGEPPVYFGFGSMRGSEGNSRVLIEAARALGLRSIVSQGWGNLSPIDDSSDCLSIDDLSHERLFPRVAAVVHHGGAGTTTAASLAGRPQVVVPHLYDQYYFAHRTEELRVGVVGPTREELTVSAVTDALRKALHPALGTHAQSLAERMQLQGVQITADALIREFS